MREGGGGRETSLHSADGEMMEIGEKVRRRKEGWGCDISPSFRLLT